MWPNFALALRTGLWQMGFILFVGSAPSHSFGHPMTAALRLHQPPVDQPKAFTMREAYGQFVRPTLTGATRKTVTQFTTVIGLWEAFCESRGITVSNPAPSATVSACPVDQIDLITDAMLDQFARWLMADIPTREKTRYSRSTVETYAKKVRTILKTLGPREAGNKRGAGVLAFVPAMSAVGDLVDGGDDDDEGIDLSDDEIARIYDACDVATWPHDTGSLQWKTYVVILSMLGPRVNDAATLTPANFRLDAKSPVKQSTRTHEHGWLDYRQQKTKKRVIVPLPLVVRKHVDAVLNAHGNDRLFTWRNSTSHAFAEQWRLIVAQAGLSHVLRQHFRATCNLRWTLAANDREVGGMVLGHAAADVNAKNYTRNEAILLTRVNAVASPTCFNVDPSRGPKQLFLF